MRGHAGLPADRSRRRATALPTVQRSCVRRFSSRFASLPPVFLPWLRRRRTAAQDFVVRLTISDAAVQRACHRSRDVPSIGILPGPSLPPRARRRRRRYRHGWRRIRGSLESGNNSNVTRHLEVSIMPQCATWGAQLEPPVRALHVVCVKSLYRIAGRDYCSNTSSGQRWPPALSPWSGPAPYRRRLCPGSNLNVGVGRNVVEPDQRVHEERALPPGLTSTTRTAMRRRSDSVSRSSGGGCSNGGGHSGRAGLRRVRSNAVGIRWNTGNGAGDGCPQVLSLRQHF